MKKNQLSLKSSFALKKLNFRINGNTSMLLTLKFIPSLLLALFLPSPTYNVSIIPPLSSGCV